MLDCRMLFRAVVSLPLWGSCSTWFMAVNNIIAVDPADGVFHVQWDHKQPHARHPISYICMCWNKMNTEKDLRMVVMGSGSASVIPWVVTHSLIRRTRVRNIHTSSGSNVSVFSSDSIRYSAKWVRQRLHNEKGLLRVCAHWLLTFVGGIMVEKVQLYISFVSCDFRTTILCNPECECYFIQHKYVFFIMYNRTKYMHPMLWIICILLFVFGSMWAVVGVHKSQYHVYQMHTFINPTSFINGTLIVFSTYA